MSHDDEVVAEDAQLQRTALLRTPLKPIVFVPAEHNDLLPPASSVPRSMSSVASHTLSIDDEFGHSDSLEEDAELSQEPIL